MREPETAAEAEHGGDPGARGRRRSAGTAPRRSELRRSGDYSGPSAVPAALPPCARRRECRTPPVPCRRGRLLLDGLDPTQRDAVTSRAAPLAILAGAGSGKTRVLTRRIAWQSREGPSTRATCSRSRSPARRRASCAPASRRLGVRDRSPPARSTPSRSRSSAAAADEQGRTMPGAARTQGAAARAAAPRRVAAKPRSLAAELASEIEWAKARLVTPDGYEQRGRRSPGRTPPRPPAEVADVYRDYEREKRKRGLVDFDDLISRLRRRARARRRVRRRAALAVPPPLRRRVPGRQRRPVPPAARVARRPHRPLRRRRPRPGDLRVRRRRRVATSRGSRA